jgi:hypothetical protein
MPPFMQGLGMQISPVKAGKKNCINTHMQTKNRNKTNAQITHVFFPYDVGSRVYRTHN